MSDYIAEQIKQDINKPIINPISSPLENKPSKSRILAGVSLLMLLIVGAMSSLFLLKQKQDTRNQASVANGLVNVKLQNAKNCAAGQTCLINVLVNTGESNIDALQIKVAFDQQSLKYISDTNFLPSNKSIKPSIPPIMYNTGDDVQEAIGGRQIPRQPTTIPSPYPSLLKLNKNEINANQEITLVWTLINSEKPFSSNQSDYLLGQIEFVVAKDIINNQKSIITMSFDPTFSKATLFKTGQDSLNTPSPVQINLAANVNPVFCQKESDCQSGEVCSAIPAGGCPNQVGPNGISSTSTCASKPYCRQAEGIDCEKDTDCFEGYFCYQDPMPSCPPGSVCPEVMPRKYCKKSIVITKTPTPTPTTKPTITKTPTPTPTPTSKPSITPTVSISKTPTPVLSATIIPSITPINTCAHNYSEWSTCKYGIQTRSVIIVDGINCTKTAPILRRTCVQTCHSNADCSKGETCVFGQATTTKLSTASGLVAPYGRCSNTAISSTDLNGDGTTNVLDLSIVIKNLFTKNAKADVNKDGVVDIADYSLVLKAIMK